MATEIAAIDVPFRLAQHIVNALLIDGYAESHLDEVDRFLQIVGSTPEMGSLTVKALAEMKQGGK
jgi:hypothetical protein